MNTKSYLCESVLVQKSVTRTVAGLRTVAGKQPGLLSNGLTSKRPGNDTSGGRTAGSTVVPASAPLVKHGSFLKDSLEWIHGYRSRTARVPGCDHLKTTARQPYRRSPTPSPSGETQTYKPTAKRHACGGEDKTSLSLVFIEDDSRSGVGLGVRSSG